MPRDYNGLTGKEVLEYALKSIKDLLEQDSQFASHIVYHNVALDVNIGIESYPNDVAKVTKRVLVNAGLGGPKGAKPVKSTLSVKKDASVPDLVREELHQVPPAAQEQLGSLPEMKASF